MATANTWYIQLVHRHLSSEKCVDPLNQGSQTRGPRAACGPRGPFVRPATFFGKFHIIQHLRCQVP